uniref:Leucine rich immune protein (Coil-less) n=1 Tax=Anopheles epiroticus TaxID=199890 RepID=A0A182P8Y6_9DIPT
MRRSCSLPALLALLCSVASCTGIVYECEPGTEPTVCSIWHLQYDAAVVAKHPDRLPTVKYLDTVRTVRVLAERYYYKRKDYLPRYDITLHTTVLGNPSIVQICDSRVRQLVIPPDLQEGDFSNNIISVIETEPNRTYALRYLDLSHNNLMKLVNLSALVQLQTLNMEGNGITVLDTSVFTPMVNLTHLYLGDNSFSKIDFHPLPKGLAVLWLLRNDLRELSLTGVSRPALRELDLEANSLVTLDLAALFTAFPALRVLPIAYNQFVQVEAERIIAELKRRNVTYYIGVQRDEGDYCDSDEYSLDNLCFSETLLGTQSLWKGICLLTLAVLVLTLFGYTVRWIWNQMRY